LKVLLKILLWTLGSIVLLVLIVFVLLQTDFGRGIVRDIAVDALNGGIQGKVEVERLGGFLPFDVRLEGVTIRDPEGRTALAIDEVAADLHPLDLLSSRVHLSDIRITKPVVRLFDPEGGMMLARAMAPRSVSPDDGTTSPWVIELEGIRLGEGQLEAIVPGHDLALTDLTIDLTLGVGPAPWGPRWHDLRLTAKAKGTSPIARALGDRVEIATQGGLRGQTLVVESLDLVAGGHALEGHGELDLTPSPDVAGALPTGTFVVREARVDLAELPAELRAALPWARGRVEGGGELRLTARGIAAALTWSTPYGAMVVDASAQVVPSLGAYDATVQLYDVRAPREAAWRLPDPVYASRADASVVASGFGDPLGPGGTFMLDVELAPQDQGRGHDLGRLTIAAERAHGDAPDAPTITFTATGWGFDADGRAGTGGSSGIALQPWLGLAGQPDLVGALHGVWAEGSVTLPPAPEPPRIAATFALDGHVAGAISTGATPVPLSSPHLAALGSVRWEGGAPFGDVELTTTDLAVESATASVLVASIELGDPRAPDRLAARGTLRAVELARLDVQAGTLEVPFDLALEDGVPVGDLGVVALHARAGQHAVDRAFADLHLVKDGDGLRVYGDTRVAGLALMGGSHRVGTAQLGIDYRLSSTRPLDPIAVASRGVVRGSLTQVRSGPRAVADAVVDLRVVAPDGLGGALRVSGTTGLTGVATPEVAARAATVELDLTLGAGLPFGRALVTASDVDVLVAPDPRPDDGQRGRRLASAEVEIVAERDGRVRATGSFAEPSGLEGDFTASGQLPSGRRAFTGKVDRLRIKPTREPGKRDSADLVVLRDLTLGADGWIDVGHLELGNTRSGLTLEGRLHPGRGEIDLHATVTALDVLEWLRRFEDISGIALGGLPRTSEGALAVDGTIGFELVAKGTLAEPTLTLTKLRAANARVGERRGGDASGSLVLGPEGLRGSLVVTWPDPRARKDKKATSGRLALSDLIVPIDLSFAPFSLRLDRTRPLSANLEARVPDVRVALAWGEAVVGHPLLPDATGGATMELRLSGTTRVPRVDLVARADHIAGWSGSARLTAAPQHLDPSTFSARLLVTEHPGRATRDATGAPATVDVVRLDLDLPVIALAPLEDGALEAFRGALAQGRSGLGLYIPARTLRDFPGVALLGEVPFAALRVASDLRFDGRYPVLGASGTLDLDGVGVLGIDGGLEARFTSAGDRLIVMLFAAGAREGLVSGQIAIPTFGTLLADPSRFADLLSHQDFRVDIHSASLPSSAVELIDSELGATLDRYFPRSVVSAHLIARGQPGGPEASARVTVVSAEPQAAAAAGATTPVLDPLLRARALAREAYVMINVRRLESEVRVIMLPDSKIGTHLLLETRADVGTKVLLAGALGDWRAVPVEGRIKAEGFALDGLVTALEAVVAPRSRGELAGDVDIDGTLGNPLFTGSLTAQFGPLVVPNIGLDDALGLGLTFDGTRITLDPVELQVVNRRGEPRRATLTFAANVPSLDAKRITLDGSLTMERFPVMNTADIEVEATTTRTLTVTGTVAAPEIAGELTVDRGRIAPDIAQGSVRPLGLPTDVRIVRGVPRPTTVPKPRVVASRKTGAKIDLRVVIPENKVLVEPHLLLPLGEVRALLEPYGTLDIATAQGELGIVGDIRFPDDDELARLGLPKKQNSLYLYGKRFVLDSDARVRFNGDMATDPQISVTARYNIAHVDLSPLGLTATPDSEVIVRISGSPSTQMQIDFGSNPGMDQANILNIIALDQPAGGGDVGANVGGQMLGALLSMATLELTRDLQAQLKIIDVLRVDTNSTLEQARITMGKQLGDRIFFYTYVNVAADTERESLYEFSGEYRFSPVFSLVGKWGDIGELSIEGTVKLKP